MSKTHENSPEQTADTHNEPSIYAHLYVPRENTGGNFCGHDPKQPRFVITNNPHRTCEKTDDLGDNRRSAILYKFSERINAYFDDPSRLPVFNSANQHKRKTARQRNSARREALIALTTVMVMNMDLDSFRVGYPSADGFICRSLKWLAEKAKISYSRAKRAMSDLRDSGAITSYQHRELIDAEKQEYRFHTAVRTFDTAFFQLLGVSLKTINAAKEYAEKKLREQARKLGTSVRLMASLKLTLNQIANRKQGQINYHDRDIKAEELEQSKHIAKRRTEIVLEVMREKPELASDNKALNEAVYACLREEGLDEVIMT